MRAASSGVPHRALDPGPRPCPAAPDGRDTPPARPMGGPAIRRSGGSVHPTPAGLNLRCHSVPSIRPPRPLYPPSLDPCSPRKVMAARERLCGHEKPPPPNFLGCFISMDRHQNLPNFVVPPPLFDRRSDLRLLSRGIGTLPSTPQCVESPGGPCHPPPQAGGLALLTAILWLASGWSDAWCVSQALLLNKPSHPLALCPLNLRIPPAQRCPAQRTSVQLQ